MKKVVFLSAIMCMTLAFTSCKEESKDLVQETPEIIIETSDLALTEAIETNNNPTERYLYVTAPSGLTLREYNNLQSKKLGKMPYGTKVKVITAEGVNTMNINGIPGAMDEVVFNHKSGFAFNGYLSKYFPPERDMTAEGYATLLQKEFPSVSFTTKAEGTASKPITVESLIIPEVTWHEAFMIAKKVYSIPEEFQFPNPVGKDKEVEFDGKPKKGIWTSELQVNRKDNTLEKIEYVYGSLKFDSTVSIYEKDGNIVISKKEIIK